MQIVWTENFKILQQIYHISIIQNIFGLKKPNRGSKRSSIDMISFLLDLEVGFGSCRVGRWTTWQKEDFQGNILDLNHLEYEEHCMHIMFEVF